jgi:hypothetical protein
MIIHPLLQQTINVVWWLLRQIVSINTVLIAAIIAVMVAAHETCIALASTAIEMEDDCKFCESCYHLRHLGTYECDTCCPLE